jgi:hypothetical protein
MHFPFSKLATDLKLGLFFMVLIALFLSEEDISSFGTLLLREKMSREVAVSKKLIIRLFHCIMK